MSSAHNTFNDGKHIIALVSWFTLFVFQIYFNMNPLNSTLLRIGILSAIMIISSAIWVRTERKSTLGDWLGLNEKRLTLLTYTALAAVLIFFTRSSFKEATLLAGGSLVLPVVEELYFRCYLLGSVVKGWPDFYSLDRGERVNFVRKATVPLALSSVAFAFVHDDVISFMFKGLAGGYMFPLLVLLRATFGLAVGGMYILHRNLAVPAAFHVAFNLSFYILNK